MNKNTIEDVMEYCGGVARSTIDIRARNLKIKLKFFSPEGYKRRPMTYFTDSEMERIHDYRRPSRYREFKDLKDLAIILECSANEAREYALMASIKGKSCRVDKTCRVRFSPEQVKDIKNFVDEKKVMNMQTNDRFAVSSWNGDILGNREHGHYHRLTDYGAYRIDLDKENNKVAI